MKKVLTNWRYYVLAALALVALVLLCADPDTNMPFGPWVYIVVSTKVLSFAAFYAVYKLLRRWEDEGTIPELTNNTPNK